MVVIYNHKKGSGADWRNNNCRPAVLNGGALGATSATPEVGGRQVGILCSTSMKAGIQLSRTAAWNQNSYRGRHAHTFYSFYSSQTSCMPTELHEKKREGSSLSGVLSGRDVKMESSQSIDRVKNSWNFLHTPYTSLLQGLCYKRTNVTITFVSSVCSTYIFLFTSVTLFIIRLFSPSVALLSLLKFN